MWLLAAAMAAECPEGTTWRDDACVSGVPVGAAAIVERPIEAPAPTPPEAPPARDPSRTREVLAAFGTSMVHVDLAIARDGVLETTGSATAIAFDKGELDALLRERGPRIRACLVAPSDLDGGDRLRETLRSAGPALVGCMSSTSAAMPDVPVLVTLQLDDVGVPSAVRVTGVRDAHRAACLTRAVGSLRWASGAKGQRRYVAAQLELDARRLSVPLLHWSSGTMDRARLDPVLDGIREGVAACHAAARPAGVPGPYLLAVSITPEGVPTLFAVTGASRWPVPSMEACAGPLVASLRFPAQAFPIYLLWATDAGAP